VSSCVTLHHFHIKKTATLILTCAQQTISGGFKPEGLVGH